jgi:hypothetical protein
MALGYCILNHGDMAVTASAAPAQAAPSVEQAAPNDPAPGAASEEGLVGSPTGVLAQGLSAAMMGQVAGESEVEDLRRRVAELERRIDGGEGARAGADASASADADAASAAGGEDDATGTDPRSFSTKFMPYYRYTELKNGLYTNELTLFGLVRFSDNLAITYEVPVAKNIEYGSVRQFRNAQDLEPGQGGGLPAGGVPIDDLDTDGDNVGIGDTIFRIFYKTEHLRFENPIGPGQLEFMPGFQQTWPTATNDVIGGESWLGAPLVAVVMDMPFMGFAALMNFYEFDMVRDGSRESVERFIGRWFYMQPLTPPQFVAKDNPDVPDLGFWLSGIYLLPEVQPIYDFQSDAFSLWFGPELGKIFWEGRLLYVKPGFGVDQERTDRKTTLEVGIRWFF